MSHSGNFIKNYGRNTSPSEQNQLQPQTLTNLMPGRPIAKPIVYSQSFVMRNQMSESEPMSEFSEMPMASPRVAPNSFRQTLPQALPQEMQTQGMVNRGSPSAFSRQALPAPVAPQLMALPSPNSLNSINPSVFQLSPSPQTYGSHYNPDQSFIMQSTSRNPTQDLKKNTNTSSVALKGNPTKSNPQVNKLSSVSRKRFFIGSIDQIVRWHKIAKQVGLYAIYEVSAILGSISSSSSGIYKLILRSEEKNNILPLQGVFFPIDRDLPKVKSGELITCVGRMVGTNKLQVYDMWPIQSENLAGLKRISFLCQRTLQETYLASPEP